MYSDRGDFTVDTAIACQTKDVTVNPASFVGETVGQPFS